MFWTFIRWGGTVAIIVLVLAAVFAGGQQPQPVHPWQQGEPVQPGQQDQPVTVQPAEPPPANKNFNL
ncbi:MAG: hypothetical protein ABIT83_18005 [Massilia sp.]